MTEGKALQVLVVDDSKAQRAYIRELLEKAGYQVLEAQGGKKGLEVARSHNPPVILLDVEMPDMDGYSVCRAILEDNATPPAVLFLTSLDDQDSLLKGFKAGGSDFIRKPFSPHELLARVQVQGRLTMARRQLETQYSLVVQLTKERDYLYKTVAHDLRNPLGAAMMASELLARFKEINNTPGSNGFILQQSLGRALAILNTFISPLETEIPQTPAISFAAFRALGPVLSQAELRAKGKSLGWSCQIPQDLWVRSDPGLLSAILDNYLDNALKYTKPATQVVIKATTDNNWCRFSVEDEGEGIRPQDLPRLFTNSGPLGNSPHDGSTSSGIGLVGVKKRALALGHPVGYKPLGQGGSSFWIEVPLASAQDW